MQTLVPWLQPCGFRSLGCRRGPHRRRAAGQRPCSVRRGGAGAELSVVLRAALSLEASPAACAGPGVPLRGRVPLGAPVLALTLNWLPWRCPWGRARAGRAAAGRDTSCRDALHLRPEAGVAPAGGVCVCVWGGVLGEPPVPQLLPTVTLRGHVLPQRPSSPELLSFSVNRGLPSWERVPEAAGRGAGGPGAGVCCRGCSGRPPLKPAVPSGRRGRAGRANR